MTTALQIKEAVESLTGDIDNVIATDTDLFRYMNWAVQEISRDLRMLETTLVGNPSNLSNFDVVGGILLPADFVSEINVAVGINGPLQKLNRIPLASWYNQQTVTPTASQPTGYSITDYGIGSQAQQRHLVLYPAVTPGISALYRIQYECRPAQLTVDADVLTLPTMFDELVAMYMVRRVRMQLNDLSGAEYYKREYLEKKQQLMSEYQDHSSMEFYQIRTEGEPYVGWEV